MAGFFGLFDYTKEGPGVYEDEPPRGPVVTFFSIIGRKFWKLCGINLLFILFSLPALIVAFFGTMFVAPQLLPNLNFESFVKNLQAAGLVLAEGVTPESYAFSLLLMGYAILALLLVGIGQVVVGPVQAGITYVLRNYAREEHAFIWSDFKEHALKNLRQSLLGSLISLLVTLLFCVNLWFYSQPAILSNDNVRIVVQTVIVILYLIWCIMNMYLYPMMVTFDLKLSQLYRNCLLFSILRLPLNFLILFLVVILMAVLPAALTLLISSSVTLMIAIVYYLFLAFAFNQFLIVFYAYRGLDRFMIRRFAEQQASAEAESAVEIPASAGNEPESAQFAENDLAGEAGEAESARPVEGPAGQSADSHSDVKPNSEL